MSPTQSVYFRHCDKPTLSPVQGKVTGTIPNWLSGTLIRNGPGIRQIGTDEYVHAFDGLAVLHSFNIKDGKATYFNRPLESESYKKTIEAERIVASEFGTVGFRDPCNAFFSELKTDFVESNDKSQEKIIEDNCSVNVCYHGDQLYALTETNFTLRIDPKTLKTIGDPIKFSDYVAVNASTAHPHVLENGDVINMGSSFKAETGGSYAFIRIPPKFQANETCFEEAKIVAEIPMRHAHSMAYFHSFGLAGDKIIFVEAPIWLNVENTDEEKPLSQLFQWNAEEKTRFYVVSMTTGKIHPVVYETEGLFTLHHCNAYEEDGQIVIDLSAYSDGKFISDFLDQSTVDKVYNSGGSGQRYVLPLNVDTKSDKNLVTLKNTTATAHVVSTGESVVVNVKPHTFYPSWIEFPRVNYNFNGKKYRYFYGNSTNTKTSDITAFPDPNVLVKIDLETDTIWTWTEPKVITPEPIFVANPNGSQEEDNGVLLVPLLYLENLKKTSLLILDAKTFKEIGRAEFDAEGTVTSTFHGEWASAGDKIHRY